ncbi:aspartic peptidase domain-containing protein [Lentinula aciculospora]|uniref:Aspartic peptidase domain-containing protein n=1 Tax=Lentinula aciculospora TaxID=153920 RepID=A0A9W9A2U4_9AGAR|nr:aspartic peptidase domain-containing protein [Lentinula aciculospora]
MAGLLFSSLYLSLLFLQPTTVASQFPASKRDSIQSSTSLLPDTLFVPLTFDSNGRYTVNISLPASSSKNESFTFALSTSTGYSSVAGQECSSCGGGPTYAIPSSIQTGTVQNVSVLDGGVAGPVINQTCNLQLQNGSSWSWIDQSFIVANQSNSLFSSDISGIMGIGTNSREGSFNDTPMAFWLANNPSQTNFSYGLDLNSPNDNSSSLNDAGTLHWLSPDENSYEGDIVWKTLISSNSTNSVNADSFVEMDGWNFQGHGINISAYTGLLTVVDPLFNDLVFPQNQARAIYGTISGSSRQDTLSATTVYTLPCDTQLQLTLIFGTVSVTLTEAQLVQNLGNSTCLGVLQEWTSENVTQYLLGSSFISNIYLIFQGSDSGSSFGFANRKSSSSSLSAASIAGVVLGSLAFIIMAVIATILFLRWRRRRKLKSMPRVTPFQYGTPTPSATSISFETSNLIPRTTSPTSTPSYHPQYIIAPAGSRVMNSTGGSNQHLHGYNRSSKRETTTVQDTQHIYDVINLPVTTPTRSTDRSSTQSYHTNNSPALFIRVSPPSPSGLYTVIQPQEGPEGGGVFLQSNHSVTSLPPYRPTDPDPGARGLPS